LLQALVEQKSLSLGTEAHPWVDSSSRVGLLFSLASLKDDLHKLQAKNSQAEPK